MAATYRRAAIALHTDPNSQSPAFETSHGSCLINLDIQAIRIELHRVGPAGLNLSYFLSAGGPSSSFREIQRK